MDEGVAARGKVDAFYSVGPSMSHAARAYGAEARHFAEREQLIERLEAPQKGTLQKDILLQNKLQKKTLQKNIVHKMKLRYQMNKVMKMLFCQVEQMNHQMEYPMEMIKLT